MMLLYFLAHEAASPMVAEAVLQLAIFAASALYYWRISSQISLVRQRDVRSQFVMSASGPSPPLPPSRPREERS